MCTLRRHVPAVTGQLRSFLTPALDGCNVSITAWPLYPQGKNPAYILNKWVDRPQCLYGQLREEEKKPYSLPGNEPRILDCPTCSLVIT